MSRASRSASLLVLSSLLLPTPALAEDILPYEATETTLDNGLKIIIVPTGFPNLVSLQIPMQTGSRNEVEEGKSGFAHFFEHMMFRGTDTFPTEKYQEIVTRAGARQNAYTTDDYTNYHVTFAKEDLEKMLEIEADRFQHLNYSESDFKTEALAVLGEYNKNVANPIRKLFEVQRDAAYTTHTYKHTTMGFIEDIEDMPNEFAYSKTFFDRFYRPEYATVMLVGDVNPQEAIPLVTKYFGGWQRGSYASSIPAEPPANGPIYNHLHWDTPAPPLVAVAFHGPAFSETENDSAAMDMVLNLNFGSTSDLYKRLIHEEQKVDLLAALNAEDEDPSLINIIARVKDPADVTYVRDAILETCAAARLAPVAATRLAEAKSNLRYSFAAGLDSTDAVASMLARYVRFDRSYGSVNALFRLYDQLTPEQLQQSARKYFTDKNLSVTTIAHDELDRAITEIPALASFGGGGTSDSLSDARVVVQRSKSPQVVMKLLFDAGSADDPIGKEGLAALSAAMISNAGSDVLTLPEIQKMLYPIAGSFGSQVDKEMTVFEGSIHRNNLDEFSAIVLDMLLSPGMRADDLKRNQESQKNRLLVDLRANNDEELGKERLAANLFRGTPYGHPVLGTGAGIDAIGAADVKAFMASQYTLANLTIGLSGDIPEGFLQRLQEDLASRLPRGRRAATEVPAATRSNGLSINIIEKDTRATAISLGHPIDVTRSHDDYVALYLARTWLGEHRSSMSHLYQRIREIRGMNYGDYAYIEAFPNGGGSFFPPANVGRRAQIFEIWIRPVPPEQAHMALRIALHELQDLIVGGLTEEEFLSTREYLMKNVFLLTDGQSNNLGYAMDSRWYGIPEYTKYMRDSLNKLTVDDVNKAIREHLSYESLSVVMITKDAEGLREQLLLDAFSPMVYNSEKPKELLAEDQVIGARRLYLSPDDVVITKVEDVFAK